MLPASPVVEEVLLTKSPSISIWAPAGGDVICNSSNSAVGALVAEAGRGIGNSAGSRSSMLQSAEFRLASLSWSRRKHL